MGNYSNSTTIYLFISYQIFLFFWINNKTKAATAHHYGFFFFFNLKYASHLVDTYTIPMRNYFKL